MLVYCLQEASIQTLEIDVPPHKVAKLSKCNMRGIEVRLLVYSLASMGKMPEPVHVYTPQYCLYSILGVPWESQDEEVPLTVQVSCHSCIGFPFCPPYIVQVSHDSKVSLPVLRWGLYMLHLLPLEAMVQVLYSHGRLLCDGSTLD